MRVHFPVVPRASNRPCRHLSPDEKRLVCLVPETDYAARTVWQLWQKPLQTNAEWQLMYELKPQ